jgi:LysM domain
MATGNSQQDLRPRMIAHAGLAMLMCWGFAACGAPQPVAAGLLPSAEVHVPTMASKIEVSPLSRMTASPAAPANTPTHTIPATTVAPPPASATLIAPPAAPDLAPSVCTPPAGWVAYVVQPNDTVFDLALLTTSTVEQIQAANCLSDASAIFVGQTIFLPSIAPSPAIAGDTPPPDTPVLTDTPPPDTPAAPGTPQAPTATRRPSRATPTRQPTATNTSAPPPATPARPVDTPRATNRPCSVFSCANGDLPDLPLPTGGPDDPTYIPCRAPQLDEHGNRTPYIDSPDTAIVEQGQHFFLYVCDLSTNEISATVQPSTVLTATMVLSDRSTQPVALLPNVPNLDLSRGAANYVVDWPALPNKPIGEYMLQIESSGAPIEPKHFTVEKPSTQYILPVPLSGPVGTVFDIYYVNFPISMQPTIEFYREDRRPVGDEHIFTHMGRWQIALDNQMAHDRSKGWTMVALKSLTGDRPTTYALAFDNARVFSYIWLR